MPDWLVVLAVGWALCAWLTAVGMFIRWVIRWLTPARTTVIQVTVNGVDTHDHDV